MAIDQYLLPDGNREQKIYVVLGPHRSGTSFLARCLQQAGVAMAGHPARCEDIQFVKLNQAILRDAGGLWRNPPPEEAIHEAALAHEGEISSLLSRRDAFWGWKDPQQPLTVREFLPHLSGDAYLICTFRKPEQIGASLKRIGQMANGEAWSRECYRRLLAALAEWVGV